MDRVQEQSTIRQFEQTILPHLAAAYNLARWLTRSDHDAEDLVQESCLRAWKFFAGFRGQDGRAWLLAIVRRTCYTWLQQNRAHELTVSLDEKTYDEVADSRADPVNVEAEVIRNADAQMLRAEIEQLPAEFREVIVLRDLEGLSYKEIAEVTKVPAGTVMSRLARARQRLKESLAKRMDKDG